MPGKRQHYVPCFLQRGFLHDPEEEAERTWLHRRDQQPKLVSILDIGVSDYFYSKRRSEGVATLDDMIKAIEDDLGPELIALRATPPDEAVDSAVAAQLITHLMLRTAHVRSVFAHAAAQILDGAAALYTDPSNARAYLGIDSPTGPTGLQSALEEILRNMPLEDHSIPRPLASRIAHFLAREQFDDLYEGRGPEIVRMIEQISTSIPARIREAHNNALAKNKGDLWEADLIAFSWHIHSAVGAVLPDCIVLAREGRDDFIPFLLSEREKVDLVIFPIADDRLLVGTRGPRAELSALNLNAASAACSDSFFISHRGDGGASLSHLIGQRSARVIDASLEAALSGLRPTEAKATHGLIDASDPVVESVTPFTYSFSYLGFADSAAHEKLTDVVTVIVREMSRSMPISTLDGITFAFDYPAAVKGIDRGDQALTPAESRPPAYGTAIAKEIQVLRNGAWKSHLVFDAMIASALLSDEESHRELAAHTIVAMLAGVAYNETYEIQLKDSDVEPADAIARMLYPFVSGAPGRYFAARESAFVDPGAGARYATLVVEGISSARVKIERARLVYRVSEDLDEFLQVSLPNVASILTHAAEWLGHRDGLASEDAISGGSLPADLKAYELHRWLELFGRDLRNLFDFDGQFSSRVFALSRHVERLLWTVQICPWPKEDGSVFVSVPIGNDAKQLQEAADPSKTD